MLNCLYRYIVFVVRNTVFIVYFTVIYNTVADTFFHVITAILYIWIHAVIHILLNVVKRFIEIRWRAVSVVKESLLDLQAGLTAFAELQQNEGYFAAFLMAYQPEPFRFHIFFCGAGAKLPQSLRPVDKEKVTAVFQRPPSSAEQILRATKVLPPGHGMALALRTCGKIGRIGNAAGKTAGGDKIRDCPKIGAYTV